jgi:signal transduction histidine kinase
LTALLDCIQSKNRFDFTITKMSLQKSLPWTFRYLEWIYITAHFGVGFSSSTFALPIIVGFYSIFFVLGWLYPNRRPYWQRLTYIVTGLAIAVFARSIGIDMFLFISFYIAKSYFLLKRRLTIAIAIITGIVWTASEYFSQVNRLELSPSDNFNPQEPWKFICLTLLIYTASSCFVIAFSAMMVAEEKSRHRAEDLEQQVESLAASLERTRIAREIHDSLGHTLTDLDIQLAVAQQMRSHNLAQSFQAVDTAKLLANQCIEDVSQALSQMRQSNFDLDRALTALLEQMRQNSALQVQWEVNLPPLPMPKSYQIYCAIKEAAINVQKHARASQVSFYGRLTSGGIVLEFKDNGIGFESKKLQPGFGIQGMIERVQLLGGSLEIQSAPTQGTRIYIILPS